MRMWNGRHSARRQRLAQRQQAGNATRLTNAKEREAGRAEQRARVLGLSVSARKEGGETKMQWAILSLRDFIRVRACVREQLWRETRVYIA